MIQRQLFPIIKNKLFKGKAILVFGSRQVGKTTLVEEIISTCKDNTLILCCDEPDVRAQLATITSAQLKLMI